MVHRKGGNGTLWRKEGCYTATFHVASKHLTEMLFLYGVTPRKSLTAQAPDGLYNDADFWRGEVDGDGCVSARRRRLSLAGSPALMSQFATFVKQVAPVWTGKPRRVGKIAIVTLSGKAAAQVATRLYTKCTVALDRKRREALLLTRYKPHEKTSDPRKVTVTLPIEIIDEIRQAAQDRQTPFSKVAQEAWRLAKAQIRDDTTVASNAAP